MRGMKEEKPLVARNLEWLIGQESGLNPNLLSLRIDKKVPQATIHRILEGQHKAPRTTTLAPLAEYFQVKVSDLLERDFATQGRPHLIVSEPREPYPRNGWQDVPIPDVLRTMFEDWPNMDVIEREAILKAIADARALIAKVRGDPPKATAGGGMQQSSEAKM